MALHTIEICAGVGMLGEGLRAGLNYLGIAHRTVCYVEREAYAGSVLAARMEEGSLDSAPIWSDLLTFDGSRFRGAVDGIAAGFPCQDLSLAGKRAGLDGARSGLFFDILDIADACGAWFLFLENVAGIASATASVVDEAEGDLDERAAARVLGELADRGWNAEWLTLSASDVGASHGRARWFCWAWRVGNTGLQYQHLQQRQDGAEHSGTGRPVANSKHSARCPEHEHEPRQWNTQGPGDGAEPWSISAQLLANTGCSDAPGREHLAGSSRVQAEYQSGSTAMADTSSTRLPQRIGGGQLCDQPTKRNTGPVLELCGCPLFAPGPTDPRWPAIIANEPWLSPALSSDGERSAAKAFQAAPLVQPAQDVNVKLVEAVEALLESFESEIHNEYDGTSLIDNKLAPANRARTALANAKAAPQPPQEKKES